MSRITFGGSHSPSSERHSSSVLHYENPHRRHDAIFHSKVDLNSPACIRSRPLVGSSAPFPFSEATWRKFNTMQVETALFELLSDELKISPTEISDIVLNYDVTSVEQLWCWVTARRHVGVVCMPSQSKLDVWCLNAPTGGKPPPRIQGGLSMNDPKFSRRGSRGSNDEHSTTVDERNYNVNTAGDGSTPSRSVFGSPDARRTFPPRRDRLGTDDVEGDPALLTSPFLSYVSCAACQFTNATSWTDGAAEKCRACGTVLPRHDAR